MHVNFHPNHLDLGIWAALQSTAKRLLCGHLQGADVINATVLNAWEKLPAKTIGNVFKRWVNLLDIMLKDNGSNRFVEKDRGILTNDSTSGNL